jgi:hypothetical protein
MSDETFALLGKFHDIMATIAGGVIVGMAVVFIYCILMARCF